MKPLVIYHHNCADGFTAAWAVRQAMECDFHTAVHGAPPPQAAGRDLVLVDFCYPRDVMLELQHVARSILVLDHHKTAEEVLTAECRTSAELLTVVRMDAGGGTQPWTWERVLGCRSNLDAGGVRKAVIYALFDRHRSGAGIAWDFFHPGRARPVFIDYVEDRDLWRFALQHTREICATVHSYPYTFEAWDALAAETAYSLYQQGLVLERGRGKELAEIVAAAKRRLVIGHYDVPVASLPHTLASDAGHLMGQGEPFAATYYDTSAHRVFSLRSRPDAVDVSEVAKLYGGGGHARAAGFKVPREHELARA
ncbi:DHHA1 domain-containing protein [Stenotrophomonas rhizophila]|uniref:DHHA1 domain-containing protein n=1 Tax=Stenotrophomonas rhizophila TaxID=216778 RepID=UPI00201CB6A2|nr:DHHA1 domain-containing protein [Stenotrophomonas rhizophila]UQY89252.1 DHHA1 domain-containing protein [Stenotrophomonas rhizophila]